MTSTVPMRVKGRRLTTYTYDPDFPDRVAYETEEYTEPVDEPVKAGEFDGDVGTKSLPHGEVPAGEGWRIYKVYEKQAIWIRRAPVKEGSA